MCWSGREGVGGDTAGRGFEVCVWGGVDVPMYSLTGLYSCVLMNPEP